MEIINLSGYLFIDLSDDDLQTLQAGFIDICNAAHLKGTVLLGNEGMNIMLAGSQKGVATFHTWLAADSRFSALEFKKSTSAFVPFTKLKVRIKAEIIAMHYPTRPLERTGEHLPANMLKQWYDEGRDFAMLDTRNDFEWKFGGFDGAIELDIQSFRQFPEAAKQLPETLKSKPLVMFCTGGIRCEKAAVALMDAGFESVYQLEGGIIKYFEACGGAHYHGSCAVFDDRIALNPDLTPIEN